MTYYGQMVRLSTTARLSHYPIRAVARMTGLSIDTLRAWERRYQAVKPLRDDRGRVYSTAQVARLNRLAALVTGGHAIGRIARLSDDAIEKLQPALAESADGRSAADLAGLFDAMKRYDVSTIETMLNRYAVVLPAHELIFSVVLPALRVVGERWENGAVRPAQEHLVSAVIRSVLGGLLRTMPRRLRAKTLVLATLSGERHELGLLSAAVLAATAGANVVYLGPDLPAADVVHAASRGGARIVLVSATAPGAIDRAEWRRLGRLPDTIELWAGGPGASEGRQAVGTRVRVVDQLDALPNLIERHAA